MSYLQWHCKWSDTQSIWILTNSPSSKSLNGNINSLSRSIWIFLHTVFTYPYWSNSQRSLTVCSLASLGDPFYHNTVITYPYWSSSLSSLIAYTLASSGVSRIITLQFLVHVACILFCFLKMPLNVKNLHMRAMVDSGSWRARRGAARDSGPPGQHILSGPPAFWGGFVIYYRNCDCVPEPVFLSPSPKSDYTVSAIKIVQFCM